MTDTPGCFTPSTKAAKPTADTRGEATVLTSAVGPGGGEEIFSGDWPLSRKQLQTVLAEFWENHFTTDYDKVAEYLDDLINSDASDAMSTAQARAEAAQLEYLEYQFLYDNALGNFGDLLLFSATSPTMMIYLDNVLNVRSDANENYAREILELHTHGVDHAYKQEDIGQGAGIL